MDTINPTPFNHTIYSRQSFHVVMMTESGEELKLGLVDECLIYKIQIELG